MPNALHDLAWLAPGRTITPAGWTDAPAWRLIGSADELAPLDALARAHLRRFRHVLAVHTLGIDGARTITRTYCRRWVWWPFAIRILRHPPVRGVPVRAGRVR